MKWNKNIGRVLSLLFWLIVGSGIMVLLVAAVNIKNRKKVSGISIKITGVEKLYFLDKDDVKRIVCTGKFKEPKGMPVTEFDLQALEKKLEENVWVRDAELFFDNNMNLHVHVAEREPVARVFTITGGSFFIDSSAHRMPVSNKMNVRLPVFTSFPTDKKKLSRKDSLLMRHVRDIACFISKDEFFNAQIAQVDINGSGNFEMVPVIGNHIIEFGDGQHYEKKFARLSVFYQQVVPKVGFDRYSRISVQFDKQLVATRKGSLPKIDSLQAIKNIEKLIEESKNIVTDTIFTSVDKNLTPLKKADSTLSIKIDSNTKRNDLEVNNKKIENLPPDPTKKKVPSPDAVKKPAVPAIKNTDKKPKAVMPARRD
jgi:cell division protein FtsQ